MRVYLRAFESGDHLLTHAWRRDPEITAATVGPAYVVSLERECRWVEEKSIDTSESTYWAICLAENDEMIGYLSISDLDQRTRSVQWSGLIIGRKDLWNAGLATEAAGLMLRHIFEELGMHRLWAYGLAEHAASLAMMERVGLVREGLLRDAAFKGGRFRDVVVLGILEDRYRGLQAG